MKQGHFAEHWNDANGNPAGGVHGGHEIVAVRGRRAEGEMTEQDRMKPTPEDEKRGAGGLDRVTERQREVAALTRRVAALEAALMQADSAAFMAFLGDDADPSALLAFGERCAGRALAEVVEHCIIEADPDYKIDPAAVARRVLDEGGSNA